MGNYLLREIQPNFANNFNDNGDKSFVILSNFKSPILH